MTTEAALDTLPPEDCSDSGSSDRQHGLLQVASRIPGNADET